MSFYCCLYIFYNLASVSSFLPTVFETAAATLSAITLSHTILKMQSNGTAPRVEMKLLNKYARHSRPVLKKKIGEIRGALEQVRRKCLTGSTKKWEKQLVVAVAAMEAKDTVSTAAEPASESPPSIGAQVAHTKAEIQAPKKRKSDDIPESSSPAKKRKPSAAAQASADGPEKTKSASKPSPKEVDRSCDGKGDQDAKPAENGRKRKVSSGDEGEHSRKRLKGLKNFRRACFSNATLQLLDSAYSGEDVEVLRGDGKLVDDQKLSRKKLRNHIAAQASGGGLSISTHLGATLQAMRGVNQKPASATDNPASPTLFQHVFAYGGAEASELRESMNGDEEHDVHEYVSAVLDAVSEEAGPQGSEGSSAVPCDRRSVADKFRISHSDVMACSQCGRQQERSAEPENTLRVFVPDQECSLKDIISASLDNSEQLGDYKCEQCEHTGTTTRRTRYEKLPQCLIVSLNRASEEDKKITTAVALPLDVVELKGKQYRMTAMVRYYSRGTKTTSGGHYTALRLHNSTWFELDDRKVTPVKPEELSDSSRRGHSMLVLLKEVAK